MPNLTHLNKDEWDLFVSKEKHNHILQLSAFGDLKAEFGWKVNRLGLVDENKNIVIGAQILEQTINKEYMAYIPMGPIPRQYEHWGSFLNDIENYYSTKCSFIRWEPGIFINNDNPDFSQFGYKISKTTIQPPNTILINLSGTEEDLLARMNQGTRRKIKLCQKNNVEIYNGTEEDLNVFCELMDTTADRKEFHGRDHEYYKLAYKLFKDGGYVDLLMAKHEKDILAGIMVFSVGKMSYYLYGASGNLKRNMMASYGLQWEAMIWARRHGCDFYDLWGIPDQPFDVLEKGFQVRSDGLWGVYGFKRGFGGETVRSVGTWDKHFNAVEK